MNKADFVCTTPFNYTELHSKNKQFLCCSAWLPTNIYESDDIKSNFNSELSNKIRNSILDGSYTYCDSKVCPHLASLEAGKQIDSRFKLKKNYVAQQPSMSHVNFNFDESCNLQCPSCRIQVINYIGSDRKKVDSIIEQIENKYSKELQSLYITASGDPFFSKSFRQFLINFEPKNFPIMRHIHLHTNAILWTENMWSKMKNVHNFIKIVEISIDAATKETYSVVRKGGDFDTLVNNLEFITGIDTIKTFIFSFVVQKSNFREMEKFVKFIQSFRNLSNKNYRVYFNNLRHWKTWSDEEFAEQKVTNPNHRNYQEFKEILYRVNQYSVVTHNMHDHIDKQPAKFI